MTTPARTTGVVMSHGFTGSPAAMEPWAEALRARGLKVSVPLLPGHGTDWQDLATRNWHEWYLAIEQAYQELSAECDVIVAAGLSMGGALALRLAAHHDVAGISIVNPGLVIEDWRSGFSGIMPRFVPSIPGIANDINRPGQNERAYDRTPTHAAHQLKLLFADTVSLLPRVTAPLQLFRSAVDHVVGPKSTQALLDGYGGEKIEFVRLHHSYHVATLDYDAPLIFGSSARFIEALGRDS